MQITTIEPGTSVTTTDTKTAGPDRDLAKMRTEWDVPFLADPSDEAANMARGELTRRLAGVILAAPVGIKIGGLILASAGWSAETAAVADSKHRPGTSAWYAALGPHEDATLTADGRGAERAAWCQCATTGLQRDGIPMAEWVRYEGWTARGCESHGFVHSVCRRLLQAG